MPLLCPNCRATLDSARLVCANGHSYERVGEVLVLLKADMAERLRAYMPAFEAMRAAEGRTQSDPSAYAALPFSAAADNPPGGRLEWRLRRYDLFVVLRQLEGRTAQRVLDIGAWNGWLSNRLAMEGHSVTAVDYFASQRDGLGARQYYRTRWRAIQMDLRELNVLGECYDVVVVNRCLQFMTDPTAYAESLKALIAPGGLLIVTGLQIFRMPAVKARQVEQQRLAFRAQYGIDLFLFPTRGFLTTADAVQLEQSGIRLRPYAQLWLSYVKSMVMPSRPRHFFGVWNAD